VTGWTAVALAALLVGATLGYLAGWVAGHQAARRAARRAGAAALLPAPDAHLGHLFLDLDAASYRLRRHLRACRRCREALPAVLAARQRAGRSGLN
jgi:hypothetical protein